MYFPAVIILKKSTSFHDFFCCGTVLPHPILVLKVDFVGLSVVCTSALLARKVMGKMQRYKTDWFGATKGSSCKISLFHHYIRNKLTPAQQSWANHQVHVSYRLKQWYKLINEARVHRNEMHISDET